MSLFSFSRLAIGTIIGCMALTLCTGCPGGGGESGTPGAGGTGGSVAVPERAPVATEPTLTFNFGKTEAKVYELTGLDLSGKDKEKGCKARTGRIAAMQNAVYFYKDDKPIHMMKAAINGETISDLTDVGEGKAIYALACNGKAVLFRNQENKMQVYDGEKLATGGEWTSENMIGAPNGGEFYWLHSHTLKAATLEGTALTNERDVFDMDTIENMKDGSWAPETVIGDTIYLSSRIKKEIDGKKKDVATLIAVDKQGKELLRFEGYGDMPRDWAITDNYVIASASKGQFRVFDRASGKVLGEAEIAMRPFALCTLKGNDVLVFDDRARKIFRIDF